MAGSNNTLSLQGTLSRSRVNGGQHQLPILQTLANLTDLVVREKTIPKGGAPVTINFDSVTAKCIILFTPKPVLTKYNGDTVGAIIGSYDIRLDTSITSLTLSNPDSVNDVIVEVWIGS